MRTASCRLRNVSMTPLALGTALVAGLLVGGGTPTASAEPHATHPGIVADQPVNYTPNVLNGHVSSFAQVGDTMFAAGQFTKVEQGGTVYKRKNIVAFSATTGEIDPAFAPNVDGPVFDVEIAPSERAVVIAGNFASVNGKPDTSRVAKIVTATGLVEPSFASPAPNDTVRDLAVVGTRYYIAGDFTKLGTVDRRSVATLNTNGGDTGDTNLDFEGTNNGGQTKVQSMDVSADGTLMVVAGNFATIDGNKRAQLAVLDLTDSQTTLDPWSTTRLHPVCGPRFDTYMRDVAIDPAGAYFVIVNTGGPRGFQRSGLLCDSASRWELNGLPNQQPTWINYSGGDTLTAAIADTNAVYIGGHMRWMNNSYGHNNAGPGAVRREGIAALDPANGMPYEWNPGRRRGYGVFGFELTTTGLWIGSDTKGFGGELRNRIAFCKQGTGTPVPPSETGTLPGDLVRLGRGPLGRKLIVQPFGGQQLGEPTQLSSTTDWRKSRGTFIVDNVLYTGWSDGTMTAQPFDGTTLGAPTRVKLHKAFPELSRVNAMFYDRSTHRLYYTVRDSTQLHYRYFTSESRLIGSFHYKIAAPSTVKWANVRSGFIEDQRLFFVNAGTGNLRRIDWDPAVGSTTGTAVDLLGPTIDGTDFRTPGLVFMN